jgi:hypothetical protein
MKIVATPLPSGSPITLGDDSAYNYIVDPVPMPSQRREVQVEGLMMGSAAYVASPGLGNVQTSFTWTVSWQFANLSTACSFVWSHPAAVPINCSIVVTDDSGANTTFSAAVISAVEVVGQSGLNVTVKYSAIGAF